MEKTLFKDCKSKKDIGKVIEQKLLKYKKIVKNEREVDRHFQSSDWGREIIYQKIAQCQDNKAYYVRITEYYMDDNTNNYVYIYYIVKII